MIGSDLESLTLDLKVLDLEEVDFDLDRFFENSECGDQLEHLLKTTIVIKNYTFIIPTISIC